MKIKNVHDFALEDMKEEYRKDYPHEYNGAGCAEIWFLTPAMFKKYFRKHSQRLNRQIGIHKLNYLGNTNGQK